MTNDEKIKDALEHPDKYGVSYCTLCGGRRAYVALFIPSPDFAKKIGQPEGKERLVVYALCDPCFALPDRVAKVEWQMLEDLGHTLDNPATTALQ